MKRLWLAIVLLGVGTAVCCGLRNSTLGLQQQAGEVRDTLTMQTQLVAQARIQFTRLQEEVHDQKQNLRAQEQAAGPSAGEPLFSLASRSYLSPEQSEQLLAELGFNWNTTGDYLIVSKDTLRAIWLDGMRGMRLNDAAAAVLALTADERANVDGLTQSLVRSYQSWAEGHVQREEPGGKVLAKYSLPADAEFSQSLSNQFAGGVTAALGPERSGLLLQYARSWMNQLGMQGGLQPTTLTVTHYGTDADPHLSVNVKNADGGSMSTDMSPHQPFPAAFLPLFPNGWADLAKREGFDLPKSFKQE